MTGRALRQAQGAKVGAGLAALVLLAGCTAPEEPAPGPSQTTAPRPFTVMTTDQVSVVDPAGISDVGSSVVSMNVFQRLMTADPGADVLKPDAARDCIFESATKYVCTLNKELTFHNGHELTSSDVKFSIERATRLAAPGSSTSLLSSLRRIEIDPDDPLTVEFVLSREDTQFGWALASPAASIVDEETYDPDEIRPPDQPIIGSGPFAVSLLNDKELQLARFEDYQGRNTAQLPALVVRTMADSASIEEAMKVGEADVVWRGLNAAAITRLTQQVTQNPENRTNDGYFQKVMPGIRVQELMWNPSSAVRNNDDLRAAIAGALQEDRTLDSVVPTQVPGHVATFPLGGKPTAEVTWSKRIQITLGYDTSMPDGRDLATQVRSRLEDTGGLSVRLRPNEPNADLLLVDRKAWTATAIAWLQPFLSSPLEANAEVVRDTESEYRATVEDAKALALLGTLQRQAAADLVVLPMTQGDEMMYFRDGVDVTDTSFGPGWQLGLWGMNGG